MRKLFFVFAALFVMAVSVNAQEKGDMAAGLNLAIGSGNHYSNVGIGAKFQWTFTDNMRLEPFMTYFFKKNYVTHFNLGANVHYMFNVSESVIIYPLAGMGLYTFKPEGFSSSTEFCFNLGAGMDYKLSEEWTLNVDAQIKLVDGSNRFVPSVGVVYKF